MYSRLEINLPKVEAPTIQNQFTINQTILARMSRKALISILLILKTRSHSFIINYLSAYR